MVERELSGLPLRREGGAGSPPTPGASTQLLERDSEQVHLSLSGLGLSRRDPRRYVLELPQGPVAVGDGLTICHGSPLDEDAYVFSELDAYEIFATHRSPVTFFGHTHVPSVFLTHKGQIQVLALRGQGSMTLQADARYLINPGSIGQPRDRDARAAYMTYDDEARVVRWFRAEYPVEVAQRRIVEAGLPALLAERLEIGV